MEAMDFIKELNKKTGSSYSCSGYRSQLVSTAMALDSEDCSGLMDFCCNENYKGNINSAFRDFIRNKGGVIPSEKKEPKQIGLFGTSMNETVANNYMGLLEKTLAQVIVQNQGNQIREELLGSFKSMADSYIKETYGTIQRKVEVVVDDRRVELNETLHKCFDDVISYIKQGEAVFLVGPAGTGKNVLCQQVAKALGLEFYFTNCVLDTFQIKGFTDANGRYQETQFYQAFVNGGLFMLDEMDCSSPEALKMLNSALANGYFDFPAPIGRVYAHKDFRCISAGNTFGLGADYEYVGGNQLDASSLDRFAVIEVGYDRDVEMVVAKGDEELVDFADELRRSAMNGGVHLLVTYRSISRIAKMSIIPSFGIEKAIKTGLIKGLANDDLRTIISGMGLPSDNKYFVALKSLAK